MEQLSGLISKEGAAYIVANDLGVKLVPAGGMVKIKDIVAGMRNAETAGRVVRKFDLVEFERDGRKGRVQNFIIADETGSVRVAAWNDMVEVLRQFEQGDIVRVVDGLVKSNQGQLEIHLNDRSRLTVNPPGIEIEGVADTKAQRKKISELRESDQNAEVLATIVQVFDPRFFEQCPTCRKKPELRDSKYICAVHGEITPMYGYVTNIVLDDGTDSIRSVMFREQMQELFRKTDAELLSMRSEPEKFEELKNELLGEQVVVGGRIARNEMFDRLEFIANRVRRDVDPGEEIERLKNEQSAKGAQTAAEPTAKTPPEPAAAEEAGTDASSPGQAAEKPPEPAADREKHPEPTKTTPSAETPADMERTDENASGRESGPAADEKGVGAKDKKASGTSDEDDLPSIEDL